MSQRPYGNFGAEVHEYLQMWYPEYAECHVRWHSCICLLMKNGTVPCVVSHAVHMYLRNIGVNAHSMVTRYENVCWEDVYDENTPYS